MRIEYLKNGDFVVVYEPTDPQPGTIEYASRAEDSDMRAEFIRRCRANQAGNVKDVVRGR